MSTERLAGGYQLDDLIGTGASGRVWGGRDADGNRVAIKIMRDSLVNDPDAITRFAERSASLIGLDHPNLVNVRDTVIDDETVAVVMDLVSNGNLRDFLTLYGQLDSAAACDLVAGMADGLAHLHALGMLHRGIKPENILIDTSSGKAVPMLTDFTLADVTSDTRTSTVEAETAAYLAPELFDDSPQTERSDLYGLGIVLYELVAGAPPFTGSLLSVVRKQIDQPPTRPEDVTDHLWGVIGQLLAKDPADRPGSAAIAAELLRSSETPLATAEVKNPRRQFISFPRPDEVTRKPAVIVDDVHVEYHVLATGKRAKAKDTQRQLMQRGRQTRSVHALKGISFTAYEGESIGVIGTNGSGKSTLMRSIVGVTPTSQGAIYASSRPSMLGVGAALIRDLSGERNVILGGLAMGLTMREIESQYDDIVDFAGIREFIELPMRAYSSGMGARLRFAIAAARDHEILIIDEALAVGDKDFRKRSQERIREISEHAGTIFLVSHAMGAIRNSCNRVIWINKGVIMMDGTPDDVIPEYNAFNA